MQFFYCKEEMIFIKSLIVPTFKVCQPGLGIWFCKDQVTRVYNQARPSNIHGFKNEKMSCCLKWILSSRKLSALQGLYYGQCSRPFWIHGGEYEHCTAAVIRHNVTSIVDQKVHQDLFDFCQVLCLFDAIQISHIIMQMIHSCG